MSTKSVLIRIRNCESNNNYFLFGMTDRFKCQGTLVIVTDAAIRVAALLIAIAILIRAVAIAGAERV